MNELSSLLPSLGSLMGLLSDTKILGIPLLVWLLAPGAVGMIIKFIQGKK